MSSYAKRLTDMHEALIAALDALCASDAAKVMNTRLRRFDEYGPPPTMPAVIVGSAQLGPEGTMRGRDGVMEFTEARVPVWLAVPTDERAVSNLYTILPLVTAALDDVQDAVVVSAQPGRYPSPTDQKDYPAYEIVVEYAV